MSSIDWKCLKKMKKPKKKTDPKFVSVDKAIDGLRAYMKRVVAIIDQTEGIARPERQRLKREIAKIEKAKIAEVRSLAV
jgi:hypothetical protein